MDEWNIIECGFNVADETINFGARSFTDGDNLYEVSTLATVKNESNDTNDVPQINAVIKSGKIFFSINKSMRIFENLLCSNLCFNGTFDATVNCFCVSSDGEYLLVCLQNGTIHCFSTKNKYQLVYTEELSVDEINFSIQVFCTCFVEVNNYLNFIVILNSGRIIRLSSTITNETKVDSVEFTIANLTNLNFPTADNKCTSYMHPTLLITSGSLIYVYNVETGYLDVINDDFDYSIKKIFPCNTSLFVALNNAGEILQICSKSLLISNMEYKFLFDDFIFIEEKLDNYIFGVTKPDEFGQQYVQLVNYSDENTYFSLKLSNPIHLIHPETINDECMYICKLLSDKSITELRFQVVSETLPEKRLERLLRKRKFEEAERFAIEYNIELTLVKKAKAQFIVDKRICEPEDVNNLLKMFDGIDDYPFKLQCCIDVQCCCIHFEDVKKILDYGCKLVSLSSQKLDSEIVHLENTVSNLMYRFDTFMEIVRHGSEEYDMQDWNNFSAANNLFEELTMHLKLKHFQECIIIYNHLDSLTLLMVSEEHIQMVLDELNTLTPNNYIPFLYTFVPITLRHLPSTLSLFVKWLLKTIFQIERNNYDNFPTDAIAFTNKIISLLKVDGIQNTNFQRQCFLNQEAIDSLSNLVQALQQLKTLRNTYNITIPLAEYLEGPENLIHSLLNIISPDDDYKCLLEDFLGRYMIEHGLNPDDVFINKIKDLLNYEEHYWTKVIPLLLNCVNSVELKVMSVLEILKVAEVPWSDRIHEIARMALNCSHPLVSKIIQEIEHEPRLIVLKKKVYGLEKVPLNDIYDLKFAVQKIIYCNTTSLFEDVYKLCKNDEEKHFVNYLLIYHYVGEGDHETALKILDNNNEKEILRCCKKMTALFMSLSQRKIFPPEIEANYYSMVGPIYNRLLKAKTFFERRYLSEEQKLFHSLYNIKKKFKGDITINDLMDKNRKEKILKELITNLVMDVKNDCTKFIEKCNDIAVCMNLSYNEVVLKFCQQIGVFEYILEAANDFYQFETNPKYLYLMAILLFKSAGSNDNNATILQETLLLDETVLVEDYNISHKKFMKALKLSEKLLGKAILNSEPQDLEYYADMFTYFQMTFYFVRSFETKPKSIFKNLFLGNNTRGNTASARWFVGYYSKFLGTFTSPKLTKFSSIASTIFLTENRFLEEVRGLPMILQKLHTEGHYLMTYKLVTFFKKMITNHFPNVNLDIPNNINELAIHYTTILLQKVFSAQYIDTELAYTLLLTYDVKYASKLLMKAFALYKRDIKKFEVIAKLGLKLQNYYKITNSHLCQKIVLLIKWYNKIDNCSITYDDFFQTEPASLVKQMIKLNLVNFNMLIEFCSDFNLDQQHYLIKYLREMFLHWKPSYEVKVDLCGTKELIIKSTDEELFKLSTAVIGSISDKECVYIEIQNLWNSVNFYHYEVFTCILKLLSGQKVKEHEHLTSKLMLSFLNGYRRISKPSQIETEQWYTCFPDSQNIDPLSQWRLPFTPTLFTKDVWNIIRPEISLKTYNTWFKIATILKNLNKNDICSYVVKEETLDMQISEICVKIFTPFISRICKPKNLKQCMVSKISKGSQTSIPKNEWNIILQYQDLFEEIDKCVQNIADIEQATSAMYHVFMHTPPGADQVNAIRLCYKYALKYKEKYSEAPGLREAFTKVEKKYYSFSTVHILYTNKVANQKYLDLVTQPPEKLIESLYADERILKKADCMILFCPDINKTVDEIAELHNLDIEKMRFELLNCWLSDATLQNVNLEISVNFDAYFQGENFLDADNDKNLKRAAYMCTSGDRLFWQRKLLKIGMNNDSKHTSYKARALKCLCTISDAKVLEELTNSTYEMFRNYVDKLFLISDLEYLGFPLDMETLDKCNKRDLLKRLAQDRNNPASVKLMASVCSTYTIYEIKFWEIIINAMIKMKMLKELKEYVNFLKRGDVCQHKKFYKNAWQSIIDFSFNFTSDINDEELTQKCIENLHLIQSCPVLFSLDFENAIEKCIKIKKFTFAAILLQYLPENKQKVYTNRLLKLNSHLNTNIDKLNEYGLWGVSYVKRLLNE